MEDYQPLSANTQPFKRRHLAIAAMLIAAAAAPTSATAQAQASTRPNIIFIMTDDHAAHAISAYGSRVNKTPNIDRLAREGALLTSVFATNSICTPSRAAILTGQYSHINGVTVRTAALKAELARLKREVRDDDQLADEQIPNGVDGTVARLRGK